VGNNAEMIDCGQQAMANCPYPLQRRHSGRHHVDADADGTRLPQAVVRGVRTAQDGRGHLFSARTLRDSITSLPFDDVRLGLPPITDAQLTGASGFVRAGVRASRFAGRTSGGRSLLLAIGPSLLAVAQRR
jgi:hypothetical protein